MKFYSTILIAFLLFGLCLIERRAKERTNNKAKLPETSKADAPSSLAKIDDLKDKPTLSVAADTTDKRAAFSPRLFTNMSLNATILSNP